MRPEKNRYVFLIITAVAIGTLVTVVPALACENPPSQMLIISDNIFDIDTGFNHPVRQGELLGGKAGGEQAMVTCPETRPQICTHEYRPVCAQLEDGRLETYSNGCTACADQAVTGYREGACE